MANPKGNPQNLKPVRTKEEARKRGRKGGKASGEARREKKTMQEWARFVLSMPLKNAPPEEVLAFSDLMKEEGGKPVPRNVTVEQAALMAVANKAMKGDTAALAFLRDTAGEKPVDKVEVSAGMEQAAANIAAAIADRKARGDG